MNSGATERQVPRSECRALIIGYGSPIRGDDAIGAMAADRLDDGNLPAGVRVISRHVLTADLVPDIVDAAQVIFIDAAAGGEPGEIRCRRLEPDASEMSTMAHFLDPRELLAWAAALYGARPQAHLVTVAGGDFGFSHFDLSEAVDGVFPDLLQQVRALVGEGPANQAVG